MKQSKANKTSQWHDSPGYYDLIKSCIHRYRVAWVYKNWDNAYDELDTWKRLLPLKDDNLEEIQERLNKKTEKAEDLIKRYKRENRTGAGMTNYIQTKDQKIKNTLHDIFELLNDVMHEKNMWMRMEQQTDPGKVLSETRYG